MIKKVFFDITSRCNGRCPHCYNNSGVARPNELSDSQVKDLVDRISERSVALSISGGEPFLRDIPKLLADSANRTKVSITSNGSILNNGILDFLAENKIHLTISLDTLDRGRASEIRAGVPLHSVIDNVKKLASVDDIRKNLSVRTTITIQTHQEITEVIDFCVSNNIPKLKINSCNPFGRAKNTKYVTDYFVFSDLLQLIREYRELKNCDLDIELPVEKYLSSEAKQCTLGNTSINIDSRGQVFPCAFSEGELPLGNAITDSLDDLFDRAIRFEHENNCCKECLINRYKVK